MPDIDALLKPIDYAQDTFGILTKWFSLTRLNGLLSPCKYPHICILVSMYILWMYCMNVCVCVCCSYVYVWMCICMCVCRSMHVCMVVNQVLVLA